MTKDAIDRFFDAADNIADNVVKTLEHAHYPDKNYDTHESHSPTPPAQLSQFSPEVMDAEFTEHVDIMFGAVSLADKKGHYWHAFIGVTNRTLCKQTIQPNHIVARKRPNRNARDFAAICYGCVSNLIAFETQSEDVAISELANGL